MLKHGQVIRHWVAGSMTTDELQALYAWLEEFEECDYGWIFFGIPTNCYIMDPDLKDVWDYADMVKAFLSVGARSAKKHRGKVFMIRHRYDSQGKFRSWCRGMYPQNTPVRLDEYDHEENDLQPS
jgi:hypothetical protein